MRRKNRFFVILFGLTAVILTSCNLEPVSIQKLGKIEMKGFNLREATLDVTATIYNPNMQIKVKNSNLKVFLNGAETGRIIQTEPLVLAGKTSRDYTVRIKVELNNMNAGLTSAIGLFSGRKPEIKVSGPIKVGTFFYSKTIQLDDFKIPE